MKISNVDSKTGPQIFVSPPSFHLDPRKWSVVYEIIAFIESLPIVFYLFIFIYLGLGKF